MSFQDYCIKQNTSIKDAMKVLDNVRPQILFVVDDEILLASLTDGDIRRYLLKGGQLSDIVSNAANKRPKFAKTALEAQQLYDRENYVAIPVIDANNKLVDIYFGAKKENIKLAQLSIPVVINAGGKGTRLEPYTKILPKPLIPIGETPIIEHIMQQFGQYGCDDFHVIVNYKKEILKAYFADCENHYQISWYNEEQPLGTGGGLYYLRGKLDGTFFFTNCDNLLLSNYDSILRFHKENKNLITMICAYKNVRIPYGVIDMGETGTIRGMQEKPEFSFLTNTGIYVVEPEVLDDIKVGEEIGFPDIVERERNKGRKVAVYPVSENEWLDMGQMNELEKMRKRLYGE